SQCGVGLAPVCLSAGYRRAITVGDLALRFYLYLLQSTFGGQSLLGSLRTDSRLLRYLETLNAVPGPIQEVRDYLPSPCRLPYLRTLHGHLLTTDELAQGLQDVGWLFGQDPGHLKPETRYDRGAVTAISIHWDRLVASLLIEHIEIDPLIAR